MSVVAILANSLFSILNAYKPRTFAWKKSAKVFSENPGKIRLNKIIQPLQTTEMRSFQNNNFFLLGSCDSKNKQKILSTYKTLNFSLKRINFLLLKLGLDWRVRLLRWIVLWYATQNMLFRPESYLIFLLSRLLKGGIKSSYKGRLKRNS